MRIISNFHDYYDCGQRYGQDQSLIYLRHPRVDVYYKQIHYKKNETFKDEKFPLPTCKAIHNYGKTIYFHQYIVGFCGKIYPILAARKSSFDDTILCSHLEAVDQFIEANYKKNKIEGYYHNKNYWKYWWPHQDQSSIKKFFDECAEKQEAFEHLFIENKSPVFVSEVYYKGPRNIAYNASLKKLEFYRQFDPQTTYQEISMYLGSTLAPPNKEIPDISDEIMRDIKGFNNWSFKTPPGKKKRRKK